MAESTPLEQRARRRPRVGLLPLYLELYDKAVPQYRRGRERFVRELGQRLGSAGLDVRTAGICRLREEVEREVQSLQDSEVDLIATLHLAYSPSLEAAEVLARSPLPLSLIDTTGALSFDERSTMDDMFENHGIHGVQDLSSVLRRLGKAYAIVAGHAADPAFISELKVTAQAALAARVLRNCRTALFGKPFEGMGDFAVEFGVLRNILGPQVLPVTMAELAACVCNVPDERLEAELSEDAARFDASSLPRETLKESNRVGLALRELLDESAADAFSMNFQAFDSGSDVPTVPFLEASKAMARGIGYAGEGDVLTASFLAALMSGFGDATFTEMFCPDWQGDSVFMSHMGECNVALAASKPRLVEKDYVFGGVRNPAVAVFPLTPGPAALVNIAPGPVDTFLIIGAQVEVLDRGPSPNFATVPHFWVRPRNMGVRRFLRLYSESGGTHHLALLPGQHELGLRRMAQFLNMTFTAI